MKLVVRSWYDDEDTDDLVWIQLRNEFNETIWESNWYDFVDLNIVEGEDNRLEEFRAEIKEELDKRNLKSDLFGSYDDWKVLEEE